MAAFRRRDWDGTNDDLKLAHCSNPVGSAATTQTLDSASNVGTYSSVTVGVDGISLISYYDQTHGDLKVAHCSNPFGVPYLRRR